MKIVIHSKGRVQELRTAVGQPATAARVGVGVAGGKRGREPGSSEMLAEAKSKKPLGRHELHGPQSGPESKKAPHSHSKTPVGI